MDALLNPQPPGASRAIRRGTPACSQHDALQGAVARGDSGQALVEFALCLPFLLLLVFGIFTFGIAFENYLVLQNATNIGARQLAISRGQSTDPCSTASTAISNAAIALTSSSLNFSFVLNGASYSGTSCTGGAANLVQGSTARVTVTYPCTLASYRWSYGACTLTSATAELIQ